MDFVEMILRARDVTVMRKLACLLAKQPNEPRVSTLVIEIQKTDDISMGHIIAEQIQNIIRISPSLPSPPSPLQGTFHLHLIGLIFH
jgi:hypothetical protein